MLPDSELRDLRIAELVWLELQEVCLQVQSVLSGWWSEQIQLWHPLAVPLGKATCPVWP